MTFDFVFSLWYLLLLIPLAVVLFVSGWHGRRAVLNLIGNTNRSAAVNILTIKTFLATVIFCMSVASLIITLAGPRWGEVSIEDDRRGIELVFLMDVSHSMQAQDIPPSRLIRSRDVARAIGNRMPDAHTAVVAFKGAATVLVPMTEDNTAFDLAMSNISSIWVTAAGTNMQNGIEAGLNVFPEGTPHHRVILLFSDGEQIEGSLQESIKQLRSAEVPVFSIIAGTSGGAAIYHPDGDIVRDSAGNPVIVRTDMRTMQELARASGGKSYLLSDVGILQQLLTELELLSGKDRKVIFQPITASRYRAFIFLALLLLSLHELIVCIRWNKVI